MSFSEYGTCRNCRTFIGSPEESSGCVGCLYSGPVIVTKYDYSIYFFFHIRVIMVEYSHAYISTDASPKDSFF